MDYSEACKRFIGELNRRKINLHSALITLDGETLYEEYRKPFTPDYLHRMYSVSKSFVAMGIGCLIDEGKLQLNDRVCEFFKDKLPEDVPEEMQRQTVRDMLIMNTCLTGINWFKPGLTDRTRAYFATRPTKPAGSLFTYDSTGSYVLGVLVERLSGMKLMDYLKLKFLNEIGGFDDAYFLETPDGTPWGDSALLCTTRALERFARLLMNGGTWHGKQLISRDYVRAATSFQSDTSLAGVSMYNAYGYGYQIWLTDRGGFSFHGMGGQHAIVLPQQKLIFTMTGDNQYNANYADTVYDAFFRAFFGEEARPSPAALSIADGRTNSPFAARIDGATFALNDNPMGIKRFTLRFHGDEGAFEYENAQGSKTISFGLGKNVFGHFPQLGYSDDRGNVHENTGFMYRCAAGAGWKEEKKLFIRVQIIDRYFGSLHINIGFADENRAALYMTKAAEDFLNEYNGWAMGYRLER